jgi:hypothetical protein
MSGLERALLTEWEKKLLITISNLTARRMHVHTSQCDVLKPYSEEEKGSANPQSPSDSQGGVQKPYESATASITELQRAY